MKIEYIDRFYRLYVSGRVPPFYYTELLLLSDNKESFMLETIDMWFYASWNWFIRIING